MKTLKAQIIRYYEWANRDIRGMRSKVGGCLLMALPFLLLYSLAWGVAYGLIGYICWWAFSYVNLAAALCAFICLMWWHDSDAWLFPEKMEKQWMRKGMAAFGLLGAPYLGYSLKELGAVYASNMNISKHDKAAVERAEGREWGMRHLQTCWIHILIIALISAARLV